MNNSIRAFLVFILMIQLAMIAPLTASPERGVTNLDVLKKEVTKLVQKSTIGFPAITDQEVTVGFLINARNELIILDVNGDSALACAYVKQILNYSKVKYQQGRQLTRYSIKIHLVKSKY